LWQAHQRVQDDLLLAAADVDSLAESLKAQAEQSEGLGMRRNSSRSDGTRMYSYTSVGGTVTYTYSMDGEQRGPGAGPFETDWREALRRRLRQRRLFEALESQMRQLGRKVEKQDAGEISELYAALGRDDEARRWRRRQIDELWTQL